MTVSVLLKSCPIPPTSCPRLARRRDLCSSRWSRCSSARACRAAVTSSTKTARYGSPTGGRVHRSGQVDPDKLTIHPDQTRVGPDLVDHTRGGIGDQDLKRGLVFWVETAQEVRSAQFLS